MKLIPIYKTKTADGDIFITRIKPEGDYTQMVRIIADEGTKLTINGIKNFSVIDTDSLGGWREFV